MDADVELTRTYSQRVQTSAYQPLNRIKCLLLDLTATRVTFYDLITGTPYERLRLNSSNTPAGLLYTPKK